MHSHDQGWLLCIWSGPTLGMYLIACISQQFCTNLYFTIQSSEGLIRLKADKVFMRVSNFYIGCVESISMRTSNSKNEFCVLVKFIIYKQSKNYHSNVYRIHLFKYIYFRGGNSCNIYFFNQSATHDYVSLPHCRWVSVNCGCWLDASGHR